MKKNLDCIYCGCKDFEKLFSAIDLRHHIQGDFSLFQCKSCELVCTWPKPKNLSLLYPEDYNAHNKKQLGSWVNKFIHGKYKAFFQSIFNDLWEVKGGGSRMLEIGCGRGDLLNQYKMKGWLTTGIDISVRAINFAKEKYDIDVIKGPLENVKLNSNHYDLIILKHSLEHLENPMDSLLNIKNILKNNGKLIIGVPNFTSFTSKVCGALWGDVDVPRHLYHFSPLTIKNILEKLGYKEIKIKFELKISLKSYDRLISSKLGLNRNILNHTPIYLIAYPFALLLQLFKISDWMVINATK